MKYFFLNIVFLFNILFGASQIQVNNLSQEISTPMFYVNNSAVIDRIEYFIQNNKNIEAIKVYDNLTNKVYLSFYKKKNFFQLLYKDVPKNVKLSKFVFSTNILYEGDKIGKIEVFYKNNLHFNKEQIDFIKKHPVITVHNESDWAPYNYNIQNKPMGYSVDYMKLLSKTLGIKVKFITNKTWGEYLKMAEENKLDVILNIVKTNQREKYLLYTNKSYLSLKDAIFTLDNKFYSSMEDLKGKKLVVIKGFFEIPIIKEHYPKIKLVVVSGSKEGFNVLNNGQADALINDVQVGNYILSKYKYTNVKISFYPSLKAFSSNLYLATNKKNKILKSILDKGIAHIPEDYIMQLQNKWFSNISKQTQAFYLTEKENFFLKQKKVIKMCVNPDWNPIEFVENGIPQGISIDTMKLIKKILHNRVEFQYVKTTSWEESQQFLKSGKCDILPSAVKNKKRLEYANFTRPYMDYKMMLITRNNIDFITSLDKYKDEVFARKEGSGIINILKNKYPNIQINETKTYKEMFKEVSNGKAFGLIATLPVSLYYIRQYGFNNLKVSGNLERSYHLAIAVKKDEPYLLSILNKALNNISENQHQKIFDKWTSFKIVKQTDYSLIIKVVGFLLVVMMVIIYYNRKLAKAMKLAQESTKLKSNFLANMSHEIRTPMNGIIGMTHLVLQTNLNPKQKDYINKIDSSAKSLLGIINDILDFSKIEAGKLTIEKVDFDLFQAIEQVITINEFKAHDKNLELIVDYDINLGKKFYGDSLRISQIITNLLSNAIKFTEKGEIIVVIKYISKNKVRFEVADNGIGLTDEQKSKLFKSFTQADGSITRKYGGTGLGLAISKKLVELMNGKIWVESKYGEGSRFIFEIELQKKDDESDKQTLFKNKKALLIDNTNNWLKIIDNLLKIFGLEVKNTTSIEEAINLSLKEKFDIILIDWVKKDINGIENLKNLTKINQKQFEYILISSYGEQNLLNKFKELGVNYFVSKPINPSLLNDTLSDIFLGTKKLREEIIDEHNTTHLQHDIMSLKGSKILLVEDNKTNQEIILGLLENSGIIIDIANDGQEAVDKYHKNLDYELILMDLQMPIMDGYGATKIIRQENTKIPIIALTANAMKEDIEKTKKAGMNKHLNKPIEVEKLYQTLLDFISKKIEQNKLNKVIKTDNNENIDVPEFKNIDVDYALKLVMGNTKIFFNILKGLYEYKDVNFEDKNDNEFKILTHTIKGMSASAGALNLHKIAKELDETQNKNLLEPFYVELNKVIQEIEEKIINQEEKIDKLEITSELRDELFNKLKEAVYTKRAKNTKPVIEELKKYKLSDKDKELFEKVEMLVKKFKFKDAMALFNK